MYMCILVSWNNLGFMDCVLKALLLLLLMLLLQSSGRKHGTQCDAGWRADSTLAKLMKLKGRFSTIDGFPFQSARAASKSLAFQIFFQETLFITFSLTNRERGTHAFPFWSKASAETAEGGLRGQRAASGHQQQFVWWHPCGYEEQSRLWLSNFFQIQWHQPHDACHHKKIKFEERPESWPVASTQRRVFQRLC